MRPRDGRVRRGGALLLTVIGCSGLVTTAHGAGVSDPGFLARWRLQPVYSSNYDVRRKETVWNQKLALDRASPLVGLKTSLEIKVREDEARNDWEEELSRYKLRLDRESRLGKLFFDGALTRHWNGNQRSLNVQNKDDLRIGNAVPLWQPRTGQVTLAFSGGWLRERKITESSLARNSTLAEGWQGTADLRGQWEPRDDLNATAGVSLTGSVQESRSDRRAGEADTTIVDTDRTRLVDVRSQVVWTRFSACQVAFDAGFQDASSQYYRAQAEGQETQLKMMRRVGVMLEGALGERLSYAADLLGERTKFDYLVEANDKLDEHNGVNLQIKYDPSLPLLAGGTFQGTLAYGERRTVFERTENYDTHEQSLEGQYRRPFGEVFSLTMRAAESLVQDLYDDGSLDKDRLSVESSVYLSYEPSPRFTARGGYTANTTETVHIPQERAAQSQRREDYRITADYQAGLPAQITARQNFQISASYTYYTFNEEQNTLTRTNRVTTSLDIPLWTRSGVRLQHIFNKSDTGAYVFPAGGGSRAYGKGTERMRQYLLAEIDYRLSGMITVRAAEKIDYNARRTIANDRTTRTEKYTFSGELELRRELPGRIQLNATFKRVASNKEDDYWDINAKVEKRFG